MTKDSTAADAWCSDEHRWDAVRRRDSSADGEFYYSVATTGVYCRPSCPSRTARREHVAFHPTRADAEQAGFRPCKRCRPDEIGLAERHATAIEAACRMLERAVDKGSAVPALADLAQAAALSRFHFHRLFKAISGVTPRGYLAAYKAKRMQKELQGGASITHAVYSAGYGSSSRFYETAATRLGMRPRAYRDGGRDAEIHFAVGECSLGHILVAATDRGVSAIQFGDDPQALLEHLQQRFPNARLAGGDAAFEQLVGQVVALVEAPRQSCALPLDVRGTAFQQRVWRALQQIPAGSTATYAEIAARIGQPRAVRAVARACADNPVAVAIPCHRVVRADGGLAGYRWGVVRKRELLGREAAR